MSLSSSPRQIAQAQRGRRFAVIPKDQLRILLHDGSWATDPSDRQGVPPVPHHVLQDITSHHLMQLQAAEKAEEPSSSPKEVVSKHHNSGQGIGDKHEEEAGEDDNFDEACAQEEEDDEGSLISWSVSSHGKPLQSTLSQDAPNFQTQIVEATTSVEIAEGEDEEEEEMEVDLPGAHETSEARVSLESARVQMASTPAAAIVTHIASNETPSCAQPDQRAIPGTVSSNQPAVGHEEEPKGRKHCRMQPIRFEGTTPVKRAGCLSVVRLPASSRLAEVDSSITTSSSSLIPATCATNSTLNSTADHAAATHTSTTDRPPPARTLHQSCDLTSKTASSTENLATERDRETPATKDTYSLFKSAYPSYTATHAGTLKNFVKAILCLEYLQSERALHEFLYDEFICAFSSAYLQYVRNAGPGQEALPAIEWFNLRGGQPEYSQMIITKKNLSAVMEQFPEEVSLARRYIVGRPQEERALTPEPKRLRKDKRLCMDTDTGPAREISPRRKARIPRKPSVSSSHLGSDDPELSRMPPPSSTRPCRTSSASHYFERMKSESRSRVARPSPADHQARLREHFRRAAAKRTSNS